jgi:protein SCO1/2
MNGDVFENAGLMSRPLSKQFLPSSSFVLLAVCVLTGGRATAQPMMPAGGDTVGAPKALAPDAVVKNVGVDQNLDAVVSPDLTFTDESGKTVRLGDYMGKRPLILSLVYYECPGLCTMTLNGVARSLRPLDFSPGKEFDVLTVSFNPNDTPQLAAAKKRNYVNEYLAPGAAVSHARADAEAGWHFLTGDKANIDKLCQTVGFRYTYDEKSKQYAHASCIMVLTPQGHVSRYFYGLEYSTKDIKLGLMEAAAERIGTISDAIVLFCYQYDPAAAKYSLAILKVVRVAGVLTVATIASLVFFLVRRERGGLSPEVQAARAAIDADGGDDDHRTTESSE